MPSGSYEDLQARCAQLEAKGVKLEEDNGCMRKQILSEDLLVGKDNLTRLWHLCTLLTPAFNVSLEFQEGHCSDQLTLIYRQSGVPTHPHL